MLARGVSLLHAGCAATLCCPAMLSLMSGEAKVLACTAAQRHLQTLLTLLAPRMLVSAMAACMPRVHTWVWT